MYCSLVILLSLARVIRSTIGTSRASPDGFMVRVWLETWMVRAEDIVFVAEKACEREEAAEPVSHCGQPSCVVWALFKIHASCVECHGVSAMESIMRRLEVAARAKNGRNART